MHKKKRIATGALLVLLCLIAGVALAGGGVTIRPWWIGGGGSTRTTAGNVSIGGTLGQAIAGRRSSGNVTLQSGFWGRSRTAGSGTLYLPYVTDGYARLENGGFEQGLAGWAVMRGPFQGHGSGLPVTMDPQCARSGAAEAHCAVLGTKDALNGSIPVGFGAVAQTLIVQERYLDIVFRVTSADLVWSTKLNEYFDSLEVSVNLPPAQITDQARDARGCRAPLNPPPGATTVVAVPASGGLAFCAGSPATTSGTLWTSEWMRISLDLSALQGETVTVYLAAWSREHKSPNYNDQADLNSWFFIDGVFPRSN